MSNLKSQFLQREEGGMQGHQDTVVPISSWTPSHRPHQDKPSPAGVPMGKTDKCWQQVKVDIFHCWVFAAARNIPELLSKISHRLKPIVSVIHITTQ